MSRNIFSWTIAYFLIFSIAILLTGIFEMINNDYFKPIGDDAMDPYAISSPEIFADYEEFRDEYIFTSLPYIYIMNFYGAFGLLALFVYTWREGWHGEQLNLGGFFINLQVLVLMIFYILLVVFNYLKYIFFTQIVNVLFEDIVTAVWSYELFVRFFPFIVIGLYLLYWVANQISQLVEIIQ